MCVDSKIQRVVFPAGMLRVAATLLALLAVLPAVTPLLGGYKLFSECRNLTHVGPGKWPEKQSKTYNFTGLLVMPKNTCQCSLVTATFMLSSCLCRLWKGNVDFSNDIEEDDSEVRMGTIQGEISPNLYQRQLVKRYIHYGYSVDDCVRDPVMLVEVQEAFEGWSEENYPGYFHHTPLSEAMQSTMMVDVAGYENSVNLPVYHQAVFDANIKFYAYCKAFGRKKWDQTTYAVCTWDVSPVRTVCNIDRGGPIILKKQVAGIIIGFVDDTEVSEDYCGEGRIHYNIFLLLGNYTSWIKSHTEGQARIVNLEDGRVVEHCEYGYEQGEVEKPVEKPVPPPPPPRPRPKPTTKKPSKGRSGAEQQMASPGPLLLAAASAVARLVNQY